MYPSHNRGHGQKSHDLPWQWIIVFGAREVISCILVSHTCRASMRQQSGHMWYHAWHQTGHNILEFLLNPRYLERAGTVSLYTKDSSCRVCDDSTWVLCWLYITSKLNGSWESLLPCCTIRWYEVLSDTTRMVDESQNSRSRRIHPRDRTIAKFTLHLSWDMLSVVNSSRLLHPASMQHARTDDIQ